MNKRPSIYFCVVMDAIGMLTYVLPFFGEWFDVLWAPLSAFIFFRSFGGKTAVYGSFINLIEEILPLSDFFPTFTLAYFFVKSKK